MQQQPDINERWIQHQRRNHKRIQIWACQYCPDRKLFTYECSVWAHALSDHQDQPVKDSSILKSFQAHGKYNAPTKRSPSASLFAMELLSVSTKTCRDKRPLVPPWAFPELGHLNIGDPRGELEEYNLLNYPRMRSALGGCKYTDTVLPKRTSESEPRRFPKARLKSTLQGLDSKITHAGQESQLPRKQLWTPDPDKVPSCSAFKTPGILLMQAPRSTVQPSRPRFSAPAVSHCEGIAATSTTWPRSQSMGTKNNDNHIAKQPETRPVSQEQLVAEVKGIYAGLVMVEAKCIEVDNKEATLSQADPTSQPKLNCEQWQALIALHRNLLHEHHDFFLASQHPSTGPALRRLAPRYSMPARMWRHGIRYFLELLRHRLPASLGHMLAIIYLAYSMMALLYETVPVFDKTWFECRGGLGRYRITIEHAGIRDRETWSRVARQWYSIASDRAPATARLYHHLAILARPNALQQLFYYSKPPCVAFPFPSARDSILTLFAPTPDADSSQDRLPSVQSTFAQMHPQYSLLSLDMIPSRVTTKFAKDGYYIAVANHLAMLALDVFETKSSWDQPFTTLDGWLGQFQEYRSIGKGASALQEDETRRLPKDYATRGLLWAQTFLFEFWFTKVNIDEEEKSQKAVFTPTIRSKVSLWSAKGIPSFPSWVVKAILTVLQNKTFRCMSLVTHMSKLLPMVSAYVMNETNSTANGTIPKPEGDDHGPSQYFRHVWHQLKNENSGSIIENTAVAAVLSTSYLLITYLNDRSRLRAPILPLSKASTSQSWLEDILPIATALISIYTLYLGNGELKSDWQLAMLATHNLCLSVKFIQQKLSKFPKTQKAAEFIMASTSLLSSGLLTKFFAVDEGRYKNPLIQAAMFLPLMNIFLTVF
ncbi:hypothetical protein VTL71DRAFT_1975 [Oculimacula yallundae]|uniref:DNA/RNA-binding domain-containing protein n=1 Tax=Oculimacula yallundae TaxID=86028 RepID=A0ABR4CC92_9HELO